MTDEEKNVDFEAGESEKNKRADWGCTERLSRCPHVCTLCDLGIFLPLLAVRTSDLSWALALTFDRV